MKKILIGVLVLVVLIVGAAVIAPFFIPLETIKEQITTRAEDATGRKLTIAGDFDLSILPKVRVKAGDVTFANAPGAKQANMLELAQLEVGLSLFPLISGQVEVSSFVLVDPVINLEVDANGKPNWQFEGKESSDSSDEKAESSSSDSGEGGGLREISLGDVRLVNGTVRFSDAQAGTIQEINAINATINLPSLDQAMTADGSLDWNGETIELTLKVDQPRALMEGSSTGVETAIKSSPVSLDYKGTVTNAKPAAVAGDVTLNVPSIRGLAAWAGKPLETAGGGLEALSIKGVLDMAGKSIAFKGAEIAIDNMNATGDFEINTSGSVPSIVASLELDKLDLNTYLPPESEKPAAASSGTSGASGGAAPAAGGGSKDWSDDPIDFSALKSVDADLTFVTGGILVKKIKVGRTALKTLLKGGKLALDLNEMALYDGQGTGRITVDAGNNAVTQKLDLKGVQAAPLLTDAAGFEKIEGTANIVADVTTRGASQRQLVSALNGKGSIQFLDGAVRGINLAAMLRNVSSAFLDSSAKETQKTDFAELAGTYTITNGIVKNDDLFLKSPLLRVDGKGTSDMPKRTVDYRVTPKVVADTSGQGGDASAAGLSVPVQITGPWDNLAFAPDLTGAIDELIKDPSKALEGLKSVIPGTDGATGDSPLDALKNAIPGTDSSGDSSTTSDNPLGGLNKLFGR